MTITGEQVLAFRKATKRSRGAMAEETGLTITRVSNIEKGSKEKPGDQEALERVMRPWLDAVAADPTHDAHAAATATDLRDPAHPVTDLDEWKRAQAAQAKTAHGPEPVIALNEELEDDDRFADVYDDTKPPPAPESFPAPPGGGIWDAGKSDPIGDIVAAQQLLESSQPIATPYGTGHLVAAPPNPVRRATIEGDTESTRHPQPDAFPNDGIRRLSNGELRTWKRCHRKWWLAYYRRLGLTMEVPTGARAIGTRVHNALRVWYVPDGEVRGNPYEELARSAQEDREKLAGRDMHLTDLEKDLDLCRAMLEGYFEWLAETGADQGYIITAPETKLEVESGIPNVRLIAKMDVRAVREVDGAKFFIDHKTVGSLTEPTRTLHMDEQMLHYHLCEYLDLLATGQEGERTGGALYNMLKKVKRTAAAKPPFFDRVEVHHNIDMLRSYWLRVKGVVDEIQTAEAKLAAGADPREVVGPNPTSDCTWDCDFFHLCSMLDDGSRAEDFIAENLIQVDPLARYETTNRP